jgi:hypothetical protein
VLQFEKGSGREMTLAITLAILEIFGLFAIGVLARHSGYINDNEIDRWSKFVLDILFPAYIFHSITSGPGGQPFIELWPLPLIGLGLVGLWNAVRDTPEIWYLFPRPGNTPYIHAFLCG